MSEIFLRNDASVTDVDVRQRLIDMVAVPWDQEGEIEWRGEAWHEIFRRGAFDGLEDHVGRIKVNRNHVVGETIGKLVWADPKAKDGLITRAKIAKTDRGDEALALAEEDVIGPSVAYFIKDPTDHSLNRRSKIREVFRAFLDHLSLVEEPSWEGAKVLAVREKQEATRPPEFSRTLDEAWSDPDYLWALDRIGKARAD